MPSPPGNGWHRRGFALRVALLSLGMVQLASAQVVNLTQPETKKRPMEGVAAWYEVPQNSLAKRRAGKDELTAAHNSLPLGTKVRVTHLANGKSVIVRITDRGITKRRFIIDLCKEAAEQLDMVREGSVRVRIEILPEEKNASAPGG